METFSDRKLMQKLVYLIRKFGIDLRFHYNWYLHGPYSPDLARTLFEIVNAGPTASDRLNDHELAKIQNLKSFLEEDIHSSDKLELIVSIDYLRERARRVGASDNDVLRVLKKQKPYFTEREIQEGWQKAVELDGI
jgi:uncharacterized protein YwgA